MNTIVRVALALLAAIVAFFVVHEVALALLLALTKGHDSAVFATSPLVALVAAVVVARVAWPAGIGVERSTDMSGGLARAARYCIGTGLVLSGLILVPLLRDSDRTLSSFAGNAVLFGFVAAPFLLFAALHLLARISRQIVTFGIPYLVCHAILIGTDLIYHPRPQEFGYLGLFLLPFYESIVAVPIGLIIELVMAIRSNRTRAADRRNP